MIQLTCPICKANFSIKPCEVKRRKFCSLPCRIKGQVGRPAWNKGIKRSLSERFWEKVDKSAGPDGCWIWRAHLDKDGYGTFTPDHIPIGAHRFSYELIYGFIPQGIFVCHNCPGRDNPSCVNPKHLWLGTNSDNLKDASSKGVKIGWHKTGIVPNLKPELRRGELVKHSKLKTIDVVLIRELADKLSNTKIARMFNIDQGHVSNIINQKRWSHIQLLPPSWFT